MYKTAVVYVDQTVLPPNLTRWASEKAMRMLFMLSCMLFSAESNDSFLIEKSLKILTMYSVEQLFLALHYLQLLFINKMKKK